MRSLYCRLHTLRCYTKTFLDYFTVKRCRAQYPTNCHYTIPSRDDGLEVRADSASNQRKAKSCRRNCLENEQVGLGHSIGQLTCFFRSIFYCTFPSRFFVFFSYSFRIFFFLFTEFFLSTNKIFVVVKNLINT